MQIRLISLAMQHFKGFDDFTLQLNGNDANIFGANATGKTTLFDAYSWVLFGVDSGNTPNFSPKPIGPDGAEIHGLETSVTAEFGASNGKRIRLTRTMSEEWVKQRGAVEQTFKGNAYGYIINDVPSTKTEYDNYVKSIVAQDVFKMITNPTAFNALDWKKRRQMLVDISGADVDGELLARPQYGRVKQAMDERGLSLDDLRTATVAQRKKINETLEKIPVQIAEVRRMDVGVSDAEIEQARARREVLLAEVTGIDAQLTDASAVVRAQEQTLRGIASAKAECMDIERQMDMAAGRAKSDAKIELDQARRLILRHDEDKRNAEISRTRAEDAVAEYTAKADNLRANWVACNKTTFEPPEDAGVCPHCKQSIPEDEAQKIIESARAAWEAAKQSTLNDISRRGKEAKAEADHHASVAALAATRMAELTAAIESAKADIERLMPIAEAETPAPDYMTNVRYVALKRQIAEQERNLTRPDTDVGRSAHLTAERRTRLDQIAVCDEVIAQQVQHERNQQRIEQLTGDLRAQGALMADTEQLLILIEQFVTDRCRALEESINSHFETVRWKLFDVQINMGIKDTCVCMIPSGGPDSPLVPYPDANNAARINAGLEIIDVLSGYYDVAVPVMIDNAESVNRLRRINAQRIALYVSEDPVMKQDVIERGEVA